MTQGHGGGLGWGAAVASLLLLILIKMSAVPQWLRSLQLHCFPRRPCTVKIAGFQIGWQIKLSSW